MPSPFAPVEADRRIRLNDGRALAYNIYGDPGGEPVLYLHGFPGSRLEAGLTQAAASRQGICLVAPDRPGIGLSSPLPQRELTDWAADAAQLADTLGWARFPVLGVSGGGPYALACAVGLGRRLSRVAVVAGMAPLDTPAGTRGMRGPGRFELLLARYWPAAARWLLGGAAAAALRPSDHLPRWFAAGLPLADRAVLRRPEISRLFRASLGESFRQGLAGNTDELRLLARPWEFRLTGIATPVRLWHGEADVTVPPAMGRYLASRLARCDGTFLPGEGHFSLPVNHADSILAALKGEGSP